MEGGHSYALSGMDSIAQTCDLKDPYAKTMKWARSIMDNTIRDQAR